VRLLHANAMLNVPFPAKQDPNSPVRGGIHVKVTVGNRPACNDGARDAELSESHVPPLESGED
jgi:hypothetical protein